MERSDCEGDGVRVEDCVDEKKAPNAMYWQCFIRKTEA
jgi:hypothetical protein